LCREFLQAVLSTVQWRKVYVPNHQVPQTDCTLVLTGSLAVALLSLAPALSAKADSGENRTISINAAASGPSIDATMYKAFLEDINQGADGGI
jgi:hypothetical protein